MKKLAAILAFLPALAFAETAMVASHVTAMERMALAINYQMTIEPLAGARAESSKSRLTEQFADPVGQA